LARGVENCRLVSSLPRPAGPGDDAGAWDRESDRAWLVWEKGRIVVVVVVDVVVAATAARLPPPPPPLPPLGSRSRDARWQCETKERMADRVMRRERTKRGDVARWEVVQMARVVK